jgi:serine phosphatase RsbU (regulator of sigma subunit)
MPLPDLLRIADISLAGPSTPQLVEELLRLVVEETASRAGVLRRAGRVVARWPRTVSEQVEGATEGWTELPFGVDERSGSVRLLQAGRLDEAVVGAMRLSVRAWDLRDELKRSRFDERFHLWELEAIRSIGNSIGGILDPQRLAEELISHLVALLGVRSAQLYLGQDPASAQRVAGFGPLSLDADRLAPAWQHGIYSDRQVALPLSSDRGTIGLLVVADKEARAGTEPFAANDIRLAELFAIQVTVAMEVARLTRESLERERLKRELEVAAEIQSHLHPQEFPDLRGYRIAARSSPSLQVAGDTYDVVARGDQLIATVSDVSGKGVGAGMIAAGIHASVRLLVDTVLDLEEMTRRIGRYLVRATDDNRFATFAVVRLEPDGRFAAVNAGHLPVLIRRRDGSVERLEASGVPLGILEQAAYSEETGQLEPGDLVLLYTDGLTEAEDADEQEFGVDRVAGVLARVECRTAETTCQELLREVESFVQGRPLADDATLVVVERLGDGG